MQTTNQLIKQLEQTSTRQREWMRAQGVDVDKVLREVYGSDLQTLPEPRNLKNPNIQHSEGLLLVWLLLRTAKSFWLDKLANYMRARK